MKALTWISRGLVGLGAAALLFACSSGAGGSEELVGQATLSLSAAPSDVGCIRITVTGVQTVVQNLPVMPGQSSVFVLSALPVGNDTFTGEGFGGACPPAAGAVANWLSTPSAATVSVNPPVNVTIKMVRNGRSNVSVDFQSDTASCMNMIKDGTETDVDCGGGTCPPCAKGRSCSGNVDCSTAACIAGVCSGCATNADCPAGLICDPTVRQCVSVSACAAPRVNCGATCVDTSSDPQNCGTCGSVCLMGAACANGTCMSTCAAGQTRCGGVCANLLSDSNNCGGCAMACGPGRACLMGVCNATPASCSDGMRDGGESGVDCGGATQCARCAVQQSCIVSSDCISQHCQGGLCAP
jgi:Cys-rich repeat protein